MSAVNRQKALKLIRAAFKEAAREPRLREAIKDCLIVAQWGLEDVDLWFTVELNRGKLSFREGRIDYAGIVFRYRHAADFHVHTLGEFSRQVKWQTGFSCHGNYHLRKYTDMVFAALREAYRALVAVRDPEPEAPPAQKPVSSETAAPQKPQKPKRPAATASRTAKPGARTKSRKATRKSRT